jgi:hypothetical protein
MTLLNASGPLMDYDRQRVITNHDIPNSAFIRIRQDYICG